MNKHVPEQVLESLIDWAQSQASIRAMLLTSTRAVPNAPLDDLSDYDVILFVEDIHPFHEDQGWLGHFGDVLVMYQDPIYHDPELGSEKFGNVTQYADGLKIDFTLCTMQMLEQIVQAPVLPAELDAGYRVLLDKDQVAKGLPAPAHTAYRPVQPTHQAYQTAVNDFFSDVPYVAKCLLRGELLPLKWCLDHDMKHVYLRQMLEWKIGIDHGWSIPVGALGKGLKKRLPPALWSHLESTYAGADIAGNWDALFRTIELYRQVAIEVGERLDYAYPVEVDRRVTGFVQHIHQDWLENRSAHEHSRDMQNHS